MREKSKKKRTRKNPNAPDRASLINQKLPWLFKYAGDVKLKYKLSVREAVVGFALLRRTFKQKGGNCGCSYRFLEGMCPDLKSHVSHVLNALVRKKVLVSWSYDNRGTGYFKATVEKEFAQAVYNSNHYSRIALHDFRSDLFYTMTLSDRVFYQVAKYVNAKYFIRYSAVLMAFTGMSKKTVLSKMKDPKFEDYMKVTIDTKFDGRGCAPYTITVFTPENAKHPQDFREYQREVEEVLWRYDFSAAEMLVDSNGIGVLIRAADPAYDKIRKKARAVMKLTVDDQLRARARAAKWLKAHGPGSEKYEQLRMAFDTVADITGDPTIPAINIRPMDERYATKEVLESVFCVYDTKGAFYVPIEVPKGSLRITPKLDWILPGSEVSDVKEEEPEEHEDKTRLVSIEDLF